MSTSLSQADSSSLIKIYDVITPEQGNPTAKSVYVCTL